jgi:type IV pilus assembly protein PilF
MPFFKLEFPMKHTHFSMASGRLLASLLAAAAVVCLVTACGTTGGSAAGSAGLQSNAPAGVGERYQPGAKANNGQPLAYQPDNEEIGKLNLKLASAYYSAGQFKTAEEIVALSLAAKPNDVDVLGLSALIQVELRNKTRAKEYFDRAFKIAPKNADLNHNYGVYLCKNGDPIAGLDHFKTALAVEGYQRSGSTLSAGADCLSKMGRDEEAIQYYTGALRFEPMNPNALYGLASLQYRRAAFGQANELMRRYARVAPSNADSLWLQLRIARKMGLKDDERGFAADLRRAHPGSIPTQALDQGQYD